MATAASAVAISMEVVMDWEDEPNDWQDEWEEFLGGVTEEELDYLDRMDDRECCGGRGCEVCEVYGG